MIDDINTEIQKICSELTEEAKSIAKLSSVSHLSKSKVQFLVAYWEEYKNTEKEND